jgi:hypothetical protein
VPKLFGKTEWAGGFSLSRVNAWAQSTDLQRQFETPGGSDRIQYSSASHLSGLMLNLGVGYAPGKKLRVGGTLDLQSTESARSQSLAEQYVTGSGASALLITSHGAAQLWHLRMTAGMQYEITPTVHVGAVVRTPGLRISNSGSYAYEGVLSSGPSTVTASFLDTDTDARYRLPFEFKAGVAWVGPRVRLEVDVLTHAAGGRYDAVGTSQSWTLVTDAGQGAPPTVQRPAWTPPAVDSRAVTNLAVGGQVQVTQDGAWALYGGYATDRSPVGEHDTTFTDADMQVFTAGISGKTSLVLGSVGVRYESGTTGDIMLRLMQNGQQVRTRLKISNLGLVYSIAIRF